MMPSQTNERLSDLSIESSSWPSVPGTSTAALTITVDDGILNIVALNV